MRIVDAYVWRPLVYNADARERKVLNLRAESLLGWLKISENLCWLDSFLFEKPKYLPQTDLGRI